MGKYLSIGQMGKLNNLSVQTLRHYEKVGILNPSYINEETGYRYYSMKDFNTIDLIKQCKALGLSLEEIKEVTNNYTSLESIVEILGNQKKLIAEKIKELENIRNKVESLENKIDFSLNQGINNIFIKYNEERKFIQYNFKDRFSDEFEINLRKILLEVERDYENVNAENIEVEAGTDGAKLVSVGQGDKIEVLTRCEEGNLFNNEYRNGSYLDDGSFIVEHKDFDTIHSFPNGFNEEGTFILICAGGGGSL